MFNQINIRLGLSSVTFSAKNVKRLRHKPTGTSVLSFSPTLSDVIFKSGTNPVLADETIRARVGAFNADYSNANSAAERLRISRERFRYFNDNDIVALPTPRVAKVISRKVGLEETNKKPGCVMMNMAHLIRKIGLNQAGVYLAVLPGCYSANAPVTFPRFVRHDEAHQHVAAASPFLMTGKIGVPTKEWDIPAIWPTESGPSQKPIRLQCQKAAKSGKTIAKVLIFNNDAFEHGSVPLVNKTGLKRITGAIRDWLTIMTFDAKVLQERQKAALRVVAPFAIPCNPRAQRKFKSLYRACKLGKQALVWSPPDDLLKALERQITILQEQVQRFLDNIPKQ